MNNLCWQQEEQEGFYFPEEETMIEPAVADDETFPKTHRRSQSLCKEVKPRIRTL
jgi:hypothetical protein